jgi:hypothetical protein
MTDLLVGALRRRDKNSKLSQTMDYYYYYYYHHHYWHPLVALAHIAALQSPARC